MRISVKALQLAAVALLAFGAKSNAQTAKRGTVLIAVRDSGGTPIPSAELTLTRGLREVIARGKTDDAGESTLSYEVSDSTDLQITMRKIGFQRTDRFFEASPNGNNVVGLVVARPLANTLSTVKVTAQADVKRKSYHLDADDIEGVDSPSVDNGWELIKRMRPDMLTSRGGCGTGVQNIWVNGKWIRLPLKPFGMAADRERVGLPPRARYNYAAVSVLSDINPEYIQEVTYHDCFDTSVSNVGAINAMFVVLKPGVIYEMNNGAFVMDTTLKTGDKKK